MRRCSWILLVFFSLLSGSAEPPTNQPTSPEVGQIYVCGDDSVVLIDVQARRRDPKAQLWSWTVSDSPQIAAAHHGWFMALDECKPVRNGDAVLVCSSTAGGVALIRRSDKTCLFYVQCVNAHSADLIGDDLLAVALSSGSDELRLYPISGANTFADAPAWKMPLSGGHGVVWDAKRDCLWAIGDSELFKIKVHPGPSVSAEVEAKWPLPHSYGHDLFPWDATHLSLTMWSGAALFDVEKLTFEPLPELRSSISLKSISRDPATGGVVYLQGELTFTRRIQFLGNRSLPADQKNAYKARWNGKNAFVE